MTNLQLQLPLSICLIFSVNFVQSSVLSWQIVIWAMPKLYFTFSYRMRSVILELFMPQYRLDMLASRYSECTFFNIFWLNTLFIGLLRRRTVVFAAMLLISIGNGNLRACITTLGARQFTLPDQKQGLERYFSHYYFFYTLGILLSKIVPPAVRTETQCFGKADCYLAVFGLLGTLFLASWCKKMNIFRTQFLRFFQHHIDFSCFLNRVAIL
jgi:dipeptide/tripeptide permease